ncbi:MAG: DUF952 domain-containing protein [Planctomycetota bacterium]
MPIPPSSGFGPGSDGSSGPAAVPADFIYKIVPQVVWEKICLQDDWEGSPDDLRDGFIHFSTKSQLDGTLRKHFQGQSDLIVLEVAAGSLGANLRWEVSRNGEHFPHLYGPMPIEHVRSVSSADTH